MADNSTFIEDSNGVHAFDPPLAKTIKFWLILFGICMSAPCYLFVIYHILKDRALREGLHNHSIIINLFINFPIVVIDLPMNLIYLHLGYILPSTPAACLLWQLLDYGFWFGDIVLTFWTSIERHILIFHSNMMNTARKRFFFHLVPLVFFSLYCPLVYTYLIFFYPITHTYDFTVFLCGGPYYYIGIPAWLIWYESLAHYVLPIFLLIMIGIVLLLRVIIQKRQLSLSIGWRQYRKMTIQFSLLSLVYLFDLPYIMVTIVRWSGFPEFGIDYQGPYFFYMNYIPTILFPFAILGTMPDLKRKFAALLIIKRNQRGLSIAPTVEQRI
jgi:hypothetical protein